MLINVIFQAMVYTIWKWSFFSLTTFLRLPPLHWKSPIMYYIYELAWGKTLSKNFHIFILYSNEHFKLTLKNYKYTKSWVLLDNRLPWEGPTFIIFSWFGVYFGVGARWKLCQLSFLNRHWTLLILPLLLLILHGCTFCRSIWTFFYSLCCKIFQNPLATDF